VVAAAIWQTHWLLLTGAFLVSASVLLRWIVFPLSRNVSALQLSILGGQPPVPHLQIFSYGVVIILLLALGVALLPISARPLVFVATMFVVISGTLPVQIAFERPGLLLRLTEELRDVSLARSFTKQFLPENYGYVQETPSQPELRTAYGRFNAASSFLGLGWLIFTLGSTLIALYCIAKGARRRRMTAFAIFGTPVAVFILLLARPLIAQHYLTRARIAQAQGYNTIAITNYRRAMSWDRWHREDVELYAVIGDLQREAGLDENSPERHVNRALEFKKANQLDAAIFELGRAAKAGGAIALAARNESARLHLDLGLALYRSGAVGSAITDWEESLAEKPAQIQCYFYLARANYDIAHYQPALDAATQVSRMAGSNSILANSYSLAGDCYTRLGRDVEARQNYTRSIKLDNDINLWAAIGLIGN
jgi:tetratricopeptide (TPR) repeat protein